jgi:hypothetical protein
MRNKTEPNIQNMFIFMFYRYFVLLDHQFSVSQPRSTLKQAHKYSNLPSYPSFLQCSHSHVTESPKLETKSKVRYCAIVFKQI